MSILVNIFDMVWNWWLTYCLLCVCVGGGRQGSLALAGSPSRRRKTLIQNRGWQSPLASPCDGHTHQLSRIFPATGFWVCSLETWDDGAQRLLTLKISLRTAQTWQSTHDWSFSSKCGFDRLALLVHRGAVYRSTGVCVCVCVCVSQCHRCPELRERLNDAQQDLSSSYQTAAELRVTKLLRHLSLSFLSCYKTGF